MEPIVHVGTSKVRVKKEGQNKLAKVQSRSTTNKQITREEMKGVSRIKMWTLGH